MNRRKTLNLRVLSEKTAKKIAKGAGRIERQQAI